MGAVLEGPRTDVCWSVGNLAQKQKQLLKSRKSWHKNVAVLLWSAWCYVLFAVFKYNLIFSKVFPPHCAHKFGEHSGLDWEQMIEEAMMSRTLPSFITNAGNYCQIKNNKKKKSFVVKVMKRKPWRTQFCLYICHGIPSRHRLRHIFICCNFFSSFSASPVRLFGLMCKKPRVVRGVL